MSHMQYEFRLFGGRKGQTCVINGHKFINGIYRTVLTPYAAAPLVKVLSFYGACLKGSPEYDQALAKEQGHGPDEVHKVAQPGPPVQLSSGVRQDGAGSSSLPTDGGPGSVADSTGDTGTDASGDGHEDSGLPKFEDPESWKQPTEPASLGNEEIRKAILSLDPENQDHWVRTGAAAGKPKLNAVETAYGKAGLTREDLEAALPDWNRDKAIQAMLEN